MLVQLSPWQTCSTSVPVSSKRRRSSSKQSSDASTLPLEFQASIVTSTKRNRYKKRLKKEGQYPQEEPIVAITSSHRVSVVGTSKGDDALQECSQWQYQSRPGRTTAFMEPQQHSTVNGSKQNQHHNSIPAIFDARNDKVYALQNENATLSCWNANTASGPEDASVPAMKVTLSSLAVSLATLAFQKGVVYGTCEDGRLFVAQWSPDDTLRVEYSEHVPVLNGAHHVCTMVVVQAASSSGARAGQKRKASQGGEFVFYQVFWRRSGVLIYRHAVNLTEEECLNGSTVQASFVNLIECLNEPNGRIVDPGSVSVTQADDSSIAVVFSTERSENGKGKDPAHQKSQHYCAPVELDTARLMRLPFEVASHTRHAGAVTPFLLAVATMDEVLLYDLAHGSIVHRAYVTDLVGDCKNWSLIVEPRKGRLAVLSAQNGHAHVSLAKATLDEMSYQRAQDEGNGFSLAVGLRSSLGMPSKIDTGVTTASRKNLLEMASGKDSEESERRLNDCVNEALVRLRACIDEIQDPDNTDIQPFHFMNEYERSVISIISASPASSSPKKKKKGVPTKVDAKKAPLANGVHHAEASDSTQDTEETSTASRLDDTTNGSVSSLVNGLNVPNKARGYTPPDLPQRFVDGATSIVLSVLQLPQTEVKAIGIRIKLARLDARMILSRLIRTGKISARLHFDSSLDHGHSESDDEATSDCFFTALRSLKLTKKGSARVFSPVDLMHEMISYCRDISEGQMITMIHFMLCKALPEDVAENFLDHGNLKPGHAYRVLAKRFVQVRCVIRKQQATAKVGEDDLEQLKEQEESLSLKLVRAGTTILVGRLVRYSRCNEVLLRNAMTEGLPGRHEPVILSRVLVDLLNDVGKDTILPAAEQNRSSVSTALISKWIFTLCEACREQLLDTGDEVNGESPMSHILSAVRAHVKSTENIMSLHDMVYQLAAVKSDEKESEEAEVSKLAASSSHNREAAPLPPYSIERLAF